MTHYAEEMTKLKETILAMSSHAETAVSRAMRALVERDDALALKVQADDNIIDQFEIEIDDIAIHLLAKAPLATELRLITVAMKISQNLARVGDEACSIARRAHDLNRQLHRELSSYMVERPTTITRCLNLMVISKCLERIADHATNVAEEVVYLYEAKDIRHSAQKPNEA